MIKRIIFILVFFTALSFCGYTQTFNRLLTGDGVDAFNSIKPTSDGGYMVLGTTNTSWNPNGIMNHSDILLSKFTSAGVLSWTRTYGTTTHNEEGIHLEVVGNNFVIGAHQRGLDGTNATGSNRSQRILLFEVDQAGTMVSTMRLYGDVNNHQYTLKSIRLKANGGYLICGDRFTTNYNTSLGIYQISNSTGSFYFMDLDANKDIVVQRFYDKSNDGDIARKAIHVNYTDAGNNVIDNIYIVGGSHTGGYDQVVMKLKADREIDFVRWSGKPGTNDDFSDIIETPEHDLVILGYVREADAPSNMNITLTKMSQTGSEIWSKRYYTTGSLDDYPKQVTMTANGGFEILGQSMGTGAGSNDGFILRTNSTGDLIAQSPVLTFGASGNDQQQRFLRNPDNGYTMVGMSNSLGANNNAHIVRCDALGSTVNNCSSGTLQQEDNPYDLETSSIGISRITSYTISALTNPTLTVTLQSLATSQDFPTCNCPNIVITAPTLVCPNTSTLTFTASPTPGTFSGNSFITSAGVFNVQTAGAGTHAVTYTLTNPPAGCTASQTINFVVPSDYQVLFTPPTSICPEINSMILEGAPAGGTFSGNSYISGNVFNVAQAGPGNHTLSYTYTKAGCSPTVVTVQTNVMAPVTLNFPLNPVVCPDVESVLLQATPTPGTFSGPYVTGNVFNANAASTGTYNITYTYPIAGCSAATITKSLEVTRYKVTVDIEPLLCADTKLVDIYTNPQGGVLSGNFIVGNKFDAEAAGPGTHTVTYTYTYQNCPEQTAIDRTVVLPGPKFLDRVISTSAITLSDNWPVNFSHVTNLNTNELVDLVGRDEYYKGIKGIWKTEESYIYVANREQDANIKLQTDGIFNNFPMFQWNSAAMDVCFPGWRKVNTITEYDPYSSETENRNILGLKSSALLSNSGGTALAVAANAAENEIAFNGFEEYKSSTDLTPAKVANSNFSIYTNTPTVSDLNQQYFRKYEVSSATDNKLIVNIPYSMAAELAGKLVQVHGGMLDNFTNKIVSGKHVISTVDPDVDPNKTVIRLNSTTFTITGVWKGSISYTKIYAAGSLPFYEKGLTPVITQEFAHTGTKCLRITSGKLKVEQIRLALQPGEKYVLSGWVRGATEQATYATQTGSKLGIGIDFLNSNGQLPSVLNILEPSGPVIDGWQRVEGEITVPQNVGAPVLILSPADNAEPTYFDDLRLYPADGSLKTYVYNPVNFKVAASLDDNNYATFYEYDESGSLYQIRAETEKGVQTIKEAFTHIKE